MKRGKGGTVSKDKQVRGLWREIEALERRLAVVFGEGRVMKAEIEGRRRRIIELLAKDSRAKAVDIRELDSTVVNL